MVSIFGISIPNPVKLVEDGEHLLSSGANDFASAMKGAAKAVENMSPSEIGHTVLNGIGMIPGLGAPADAINAGWYAAQGDWGSAALSAATAIPGIGDFVGGARLGATALKLGEDGVKAERLIKDGTEAASVAKNAEKGLSAAKGAEDAGKVAKSAEYAGKAAKGTEEAGTAVAGADPLTGPVVFRAPPGASAEEIAQLQEYVQGSNEALAAGKLSPTGRVSTAGDLRTDASVAASQERTRAAAQGVPYQGHVGHVPDTTWTGNPQPHKWLDLTPRLNSSLGGQAAHYPLGYKPTGFAVEP
jgi:hypothetical protein